MVQCRGPVIRGQGVRNPPFHLHARAYSTAVGVFPFVGGFIHANADAPPTGFAARGKPAEVLREPCDAAACVDAGGAARDSLAVLRARFASHRTVGGGGCVVPFSAPADAAELLRLYSPLARGGGGSYAAPVRAEVEPLDFCGFSTFMLRLPRPAGW